jgi:hypothetical protein
MTPDAVKYQMTLENEQRLRARTWQPDDDGWHGDAPIGPARWSDLAITPTSRLIVWMLHRPGHRWWLGAILAPAYMVVVYLLWRWTPTSDAAALIAVVGIAVAGWNAAKFAFAALRCAALAMGLNTARP